MRVHAETVPRFPRGIRYRFDAVRGAWVLLTPERALITDGPAQAVLAETDGRRSIGAIIGTLAARYTAPAEVIAHDVLEMITDLMEQGVVVAHGPAA